MFFQKQIRNVLKIFKNFENCSLEMKKIDFLEKLMGLPKPPEGIFPLPRPPGGVGPGRPLQHLLSYVSVIALEGMTTPKGKGRL